MATVHSLEKERRRRREKKAASDLAKAIDNIRLIAPPQPDLFASQQRIKRIFRCDPCQNQFSVEQPVVRPIQTLCPRCGRSV